MQDNITKLLLALVAISLLVLLGTRRPRRVERFEFDNFTCFVTSQHLQCFKTKVEELNAE